VYGVEREVRGPADTDSEERVERYTPGPGTFTVTDFGTLSSDLKTDKSIIYDLSIPMRYTLGDGSESFRWRLVEATQYAGLQPNEGPSETR